MRDLARRWVRLAATISRRRAAKFGIGHRVSWDGELGQLLQKVAGIARAQSMEVGNTVCAVAPQVGHSALEHER